MDSLSAWWAKLTATRAPAAMILVRFYVGGIFLSEGIQKFLYQEDLGEGRFDEAGIPAPGLVADLDAVFEIACGALLLVGLATRLAAVPMIVNMVGALAITKLPILWSDAALFPDASGWWDFTHESRTDLAQLCGSLVLLILGAGAWSLDARRSATATTAEPSLATETQP